MHEGIPFWQADFQQADFHLIENEHPDGGTILTGGFLSRRREYQSRKLRILNIFIRFSDADSAVLTHTLAH